VDYTVTHVTRFEYESAVHESLTEVRLAPRNDGRQEVRSFELRTNPAAAIFSYTDALGNDVRHFDIVAPHRELLIQTRAQVRTSAVPELPECLEPSAWDALARMRADGQLWDFFEPSPRVPLSAAVRTFAEDYGLVRASDPLTCFRRIVSAVHGALVYMPDSTTVDTPIETVLHSRRGVCQDFAHAALALVRAYGIPCRYVSGYFAPAADRGGSQNLTSHAWVEAWLPGIEWTALDPTYDTAVGESHISVAVGRDYGDAAPTRGLFRGGFAGTLSVAVTIEQGDQLASADARPRPVAGPAGIPPPVARWDQ
jgi:transglutaminase-like putative cysteine protease